MQHPYASSSYPILVLTAHFNFNKHRSLKFLLFVKRIEHPPLRNRQFDNIIDFSLPQYQCLAMDSVLTTMANWFLYVLNNCCTISIATMLALHPIPERLKDLMLSLILYLFIIREVNDGAGENNETSTTSMSISDGETPVFSNRVSRVLNMISSISACASFSEGNFSLPSITFLGP
ncbi:hypothetical protein CXB51_025082 [Gossypium anomalum]|uniref:Uncharacterized protein n=1 Tax=Gossypium anomalum TaxID=47600 RepID=A0A8J6CUH4_9ROSI|nr:hypothetical protein CXB51_025082 [Gossypium anomalum]